MVSIRKQIADTIRFIRKNYSTNPVRDRVEETVEIIDTTYSHVSIADLAMYTKGHSTNDIYIRGESFLDYDDIPINKVFLFRLRKQTDEEYFDTVCSYVLPSSYQIEQYETYLRLKQIYGD
jgi:hypothetical protein